MKTSEKMGYGPDERLLLINTDDFGMCQAANAGILELAGNGLPVSATLMVTCPWAFDASIRCRQLPRFDLGVHLTMTSEWSSYKWGPVNDVCKSASLRDPNGFFYDQCKPFEEQADADEVKAEIIAQIEKALQWGLDPTHLDNHMGSLYGLATGRSFVQILIEIAAHYRLPLRLPRFAPIPDAAPSVAELAAASVRFADQMGVLIPDYLLNWPYAPETATYAEAKQRMFAALREMPPGISELIMHPSVVNDELKAIMPHWHWRGMEYTLLGDPELWQQINAEGIRVIHWSDLRTAQQNMA